MNRSWGQLTAIVLTILVLTFSSCSLFITEQPKNIILFIGDGMGPEQVAAGGMYATGEAKSLFFELFNFQTEMKNYSADSAITDSAAAATAMATGYKVNNGVIAKALPGSGDDLTTVMDYYQDLGKSIGIVSTAYLTHATPAAFGGHATSRSDLPNIAWHYLNTAHAELMFGGGANALTKVDAEAAGFTVVENESELDSIVSLPSGGLLGLFGSDHMPYEYDGLGALPLLSEMTLSAIALLESDPDGYFLMVEGARIDHAGHVNDVERMVFEVLGLERAVEDAVGAVDTDIETLVVVTADHETGGLAITQNNGVGVIPSVTWSTDYHTAVNVGVYAIGPGARKLGRVSDNTEIFDKLMKLRR